MEYIPQQLRSAEAQLKSDQLKLVFTTPRELVGWFGHFRRTWRQVRRIRAALKQCGIYTFPDFEGAEFDEVITLQLEASKVAPQTTTTIGQPMPLFVNGADPMIIPPISSTQSTDTQSQPEPTSTNEISTPVVDPVHRVARFLSGRELVTVARDETVQVAITKMMMQDFSQLPVMQGSRNPVGMISWRSIGQPRALGSDPQFVRECMEPFAEVRDTASIFDAIELIKERECVLVRNSKNEIHGILTATDISASFEQLSRPFLYLSYIENHLRALIQPTFSIEDLQAAKDPSDTQRQIIDVHDMTFGEYIRLLEKESHWTKLGLGLERSLFVIKLNEVRDIRNDVMHFNPEGIEEKDLDTLKQFNSLMQTIVAGQQSS